MNIRSLSNPSPVLGKEKIEAAKSSIKSDETAEREANGQQPFSDPEEHRPLTEEETEKVLEKIKAHEGIQKNGLLVSMVEENGQKIVKIETSDGKILKRFVERDLFHFLMQGQNEDIHLVDKSA